MSNTIEFFGESAKVKVGVNDFINYKENINGTKCLEISVSPLSINTVAYVKIDSKLFPNLKAEAGISLSNRINGLYSSFEINGKYITDKDTVFNVATANQTNSLITLTLSSVFTGNVGDYVEVKNLSDSRMNYSGLLISSISTDKLTISGSISNDVTIPSFTSTPNDVVATNSIITLRVRTADNSARYKFSGTSHNQASLQTRFNAGTIRNSGIVLGNSLISIGATNYSLNSLGNGYFNRNANNKFHIDLVGNKLSFTDCTLDNDVMETTRLGYNSVVPDNVEYNVLYKIETSSSRSIPLAKIKTISKTGNNTCTVTTDVPHGLIANKSYVELGGIRDNINFPRGNGLVKTTPSTTTFTIDLGTSVTSNSIGGYVSLYNGSVGVDSSLNASISSYSIVSGRLVLSMTSSVGNIGEYVTLYGLMNGSGNDIGLDGVYSVYDVNNTTLILEPLVVESLITSGSNIVNKTLSTTGNTNIGGAVLLNHTMRIHNMLFETKAGMTIDGQGQRSKSKAIPVVSVEPLEVAMVDVKPSVFKLQTTASTNLTSVKTGESVIYSANVSNVSTSMFYLKIYDDNSAPSLASDIPYAIIPIPALSFIPIEFGKNGVTFSNGIGIATTTGIGNTDTGVITNGCLININYK